MNEPANLPTVAVLGLGAMGMGMARRLNEDLDVLGFDISPTQRDKASGFGISVASTASEAARRRNVVLVAVRDSTQLEDCLFGVDGVVEVMEPGAVVMLTSTVGREGIPAVAERLKDKQLHLVDAPLSGGPARAAKGDLLVVVGATQEALAAAQPVLDRMASTLTIVGNRPGDGQAFKTVNQLLCGVHIAAAAEAMALAEAMGLDPAMVLPGLMAGAASSFMLGDRGKRMLQAYDEDGAEVLSRLDIFVKDMGIVTAAARDHHVAAPVAAAAQSLYLLGEAAGKGAQDDSSVITIISPTRRQPEPGSTPTSQN